MKLYTDFSKVTEAIDYIAAKSVKCSDLRKFNTGTLANPNNPASMEGLMYPKTLVLNPRTGDVTYIDITPAWFDRILIKPIIKGLIDESHGIRIVSRDGNYYYPRDMYNAEELKEILEAFVNARYDTTKDCGYNEFKAKLYRDTFVDCTTVDKEVNWGNGLEDEEELGYYISQTMGNDYYKYLEHQTKKMIESTKHLSKDIREAIRDVMFGAYYLGTEDDDLDTISNVVVEQELDTEYTEITDNIPILRKCRIGNNFFRFLLLLFEHISFGPLYQH